MNLDRLTEKRKQRTVYYVDKENKITAKVCSKCEALKSLDDFTKHSKCLGGRNPVCKDCRALYRIDTAERIKETRLKHQEKEAERKRAWKKENREKVRIQKQKRRARRSVLINDLNLKQYETTLKHFEYRCALTSVQLNVEIEHAIPVSIGHGGTTFGNCYPLRKDLNASKQNSNIFEWFEANRQRFNLSQERFDRLIEWLGKANGMTVEEYRDYVYWCHANPRNIDELKAQ